MRKIVVFSITTLAIILLGLIGWQFIQPQQEVDIQEVREKLNHIHQSTTSVVYLNEIEESTWLLQTPLGGGKLLNMQNVSMLSIKKDTLWFGNFPLLFSKKTIGDLNHYLFKDNDTINQQHIKKPSLQLFEEQILIPLFEEDSIYNEKIALKEIETFANKSASDYFGNYDTIPIKTVLSTLLIHQILNNQTQNVESILLEGFFKSLPISKINLQEQDNLVLRKYNTTKAAQQITNLDQPTFQEWLIYGISGLLAFLTLFLIFYKPKEKGKLKWLDSNGLTKSYQLLQKQPNNEHLKHFFKNFTFDKSTQDFIEKILLSVDAVHNAIKNIEYIDTESVTADVDYTVYGLNLTKSLVKIHQLTYLPTTANNLENLAIGIFHQSYTTTNLRIVTPDFIQNYLTTLEKSQLAKTENIKQNLVTFQEELHSIIKDADKALDLKTYLLQFNKRYRMFMPTIQQMNYPPTALEKANFFRWLFGMAFHICDFTMVEAEDVNSSKYQTSNIQLIVKDEEIANLHPANYHVFSSHPEEMGRMYRIIHHIAKEIGIQELEDVLINGIYIPKMMLNSEKVV